MEQSNQQTPSQLCRRLETILKKLSTELSKPTSIDLQRELDFVLKSLGPGGEKQLASDHRAWESLHQKSKRHADTPDDVALSVRLRPSYLLFIRLREMRMAIEKLKRKERKEAANRIRSLDIRDAMVPSGTLSSSRRVRNPYLPRGNRNRAKPYYSCLSKNSQASNKTQENSSKETTQP
jgi:hypothetical protein